MTEPSPSSRKAERPWVAFVGARLEAVAVTQLLEEANVEVRWLDDIDELEASIASEASAKPRVVFLDLERCGDVEDGVILSIQRASPHATIVALAGDLDGERAARLLVSGVASLNKPVRDIALAAVALRLSGHGSGEMVSLGARSTREGSGRLEPLLELYSKQRSLSGQQRTILRLHLAGKNDKEIASDCSCSEATVYEHWRRMARKAGGNHKSCVIIDFHRFLDDG